MAPLRFAGVIMLSMPVSEADKGAKNGQYVTRTPLFQYVATTLQVLDPKCPH